LHVITFHEGSPLETFDDLPPLLLARLELLQERIDAQQLVIAWLLNELQNVPHFQPDLVQRFLSRQANELDGHPKFAEHVAVLDELREDVAFLSSQANTQR